MNISITTLHTFDGLTGPVREQSDCSSVDIQHKNLFMFNLEGHKFSLGLKCYHYTI